MNYIINGAVISNVGKIRENNEDNFYFNNGIFNEEEKMNEPFLDEFSNEENKIFAVFDGMGGEANGERASYLGAKTLKEMDHKIEFDWDDYVEKANDKICIEMTNHKRMGSTMAGVQFLKEKIIISNLGDSKIYILSSNSFGQVSMDHVEKIYTTKKPRLTQYFGIKKEEMIIQPFQKEYHYENVEKILVCSDGLSDMVKSSEIEEILEKEITTKECVEELLKKALNNGGEDNITIMLFSINKKEEDNKKTLKEKISDIWNILKS